MIFHFLLKFLSCFKSECFHYISEATVLVATIILEYKGNLNIGNLNSECLKTRCSGENPFTDGVALTN